MLGFNVLGTLQIGENTAITIDCNSESLKNGIDISDENGKTYKVISVGMDAGNNAEGMLNKTSLLIQGSFTSTKIYI